MRILTAYEAGDTLVGTDEGAGTLRLDRRDFASDLQQASGFLAH